MQFIIVTWIYLKSKNKKKKNKQPNWNVLTRGSRNIDSRD